MEAKYKECKDCRYIRRDEDTGKYYCKQTYTWVNPESEECLGFEPDDLDW